MIDKKNLQIEDAMRTLATQEDVTSAKKWLSDLVTQNHDLISSVDNLSDKYYKIDNLAEKIDASVNIIAGLKTIIADKEDEHTSSILTELNKLEAAVSDITTNQSFEEFKVGLEAILNDISNSSSNLQNAFINASSEIQKINSELKALDIAANFQNINTTFKKTEQDLKAQINNAADKITQLADINVTRTLNDISTSADALSNKLKETYSAITGMCEKNFGEVLSDISGLKTVVAQIDENNVSANNAIFSNITDRLALFENSLKNSLEKQEDYVENSSNHLVEQITNIKNLSGVLDYKLDSSVIEIGNAKREFSELKSAVQDILALDFTNVVKDLKVDLYASKQDLATALETSSNDLAEKFTEDLFGKYELLISKLDSVEDELQKTQIAALNNLKPILENISSSIVDILTYVGESKKFNIDDINIKLADITEFVKDSNLNYVENVRDVVEVIRKQVENNLLQIQKDTSTQINTLNNISKNTEDLREEIKYSYNKLLEVQDSFESLKISLDSNQTLLNENLTDIVASADNVKAEFENKLDSLKNAIFEKISTFEQEFTCENADNLSEIKFATENLFTKVMQNSSDVKSVLSSEISQIIDTLKLDIQNLAELFNTNSLKQTDASMNIEVKVDTAVSGLKTLDESVNKLSVSNITQISENFAALKTLINNYNLKSDSEIKQTADSISNDIAALRRLIESVNNDISADLSKQLNILENRFETLSGTISDLLEHGDLNLNTQINTSFADISTKIGAQIDELTDNFVRVEDCINSLASNTTKSLAGTLAQILDNFVALKSLMNNLNEKTTADIKDTVSVLYEEFTELKDLLENIDSNIDEDLTRQLSIIEHNFESLAAGITDLFSREDAKLGARIDSGFADISGKMQIVIAEKLEQYKNKLEALFTNISNKNNEQAEFIKERVVGLNKALAETLSKQSDIATKQLNDIALGLKNILDDNLKVSAEEYNNFRTRLELFVSNVETTNNNLIDAVKVQLNEIARLSEAHLEVFSSNLTSEFANNIAQVLTESDNLKLKIEGSITSIDNSNKNLADDLKTQLDDFTKFIDSGLDIQVQEVNAKFEDISSKIQQISTNILGLNEKVKDKIDGLNGEFENIKAYIASSVDNNSRILINKIEDVLKDLTAKNEEIASSVILASADIKGDIKTSITSDIHNISSLVETRLTEIDELVENTAICQQNNILNQTKNLLDELHNVNNSLKEELTTLKQDFSENIISEVNGLADKVQTLFEEHSLNFTTQLGNTNTKFAEDMSSLALELKTAFENLNERLDKDEISRMNVFQAHLKELGNTFNILISEAKNVTKSEVSAISETLIKNSKELMEEVEQSIEEKVNSMLATSADISAGELQSMEAFTNKILEQIEQNKQNSVNCKNLIVELLKNQFNILAGNIEKETDIIVKDIIEQFDLMKGTQKDELSNLTVHIESSVEDYIYNYVNDLKSYLDIKTDSTVINNKLDNLKNELFETAENVLDNMDKFLEASVFSSAMSDLRTANEILVNSMADKLNNQIQEFITENAVKFEDRLNFFDKKFIDTIVDKYEEIKLITSKYDKGFETIQTDIQGLVTRFSETKNTITNQLVSLSDNLSTSIDSLSMSFADLKAQILNKSFDEAFQASLNNQITGIETLVNEQLGYLEDISELCCANLPELTEMNTLVKYGIQQSVTDLASKFDERECNLQKELDKLKSDVITQFLNIFNQISFVAEQEEIIDFIQEKHADLITILSHIVTTVDNVETVKNNISVVDSKIDTVREDINNINEKINSIISSEGDINYIYSLQDLESDIANLRLVLNEMKEDNKSKEFDELISSTNDIYKLVESIKTEMPKFELEEFKRDFNTLSEDIVSISTRTNKLILASDESYKTLQDNLQDFKLVINDLDERTRNFAHEAGIDRIDNKLGSINAMIQNGAKTNQVFNQVFEYLAEWVDKAGEQITTISDKVETLDDIGQIKVMLEDLKAEAEDNSESTELIEALSNVFDKQTKRISSLEAKLDRVIVETTINNKNNKIDMSPFETTLNKFLVAIDDRMSEQQDKINSLESKLAEVMTLIDPKDTAQLTKKVGGMDRQIAKLNKSIEKIASHVVEK